jgi:hypothetical protein
MWATMKPINFSSKINNGGEAPLIHILRRGAQPRERGFKICKNVGSLIPLCIHIQNISANISLSPTDIRKECLHAENALVK